MAGDPEIDYTQLFDAVPVACLVLTPQLVIVASNPAREQATGRAHDDVAGRHLFEAFPDNPDDPEARGVRNLNASLQRVLASGEPDRMAVQRYDLAAAEGGYEERYWQPVNVPVCDASGRVTQLLHVVEDVTEELRAQHEAAAAERRFRTLVEHASDVIMIIGHDQCVRYVSPAAAHVFGADSAELEGVTWRDVAGSEVADVEHRGRATALLDAAVNAQAGGTVSGQLPLAAADGERWVHVQATNHLDTPAVAGVVLNIRDVTAQRQAERTLATLALQDPLTGLANRRAFMRAVERSLAHAARTGRPAAVILFDLDHFKAVNDTFGHAAGDEVLVGLSAAIGKVLRPGDVFARFGGDEFAVLAQDLTGPADAVGVAERVRTAGRQLLRSDRRTAGRASLSVGVATGTEATDPDTLLRHADAALYQAKEQGRDRVEIFGGDLRAQQRRRGALADDLGAALAQDQIVLRWQPVAAADSGAVVGVEALVRWDHPARGLLSPHEFLPVARQSGLMAGLDDRVLGLALGQATAWRAAAQGAGREPPQIFVNLSAAQLADPDFADHLTRLAAARGVAAAQLCLDVSERLLVVGPPRAAEHVETLHSAGFGVALDDFGASGGGVSQLWDLPWDVLKLDRRFAAAADDPAAGAFVGAVVGLGAARGAAVLAEGVEDAAERAAVRRWGCQLLQGFAIARPQSAADLAAALPGAPA